MNSLIWFRNDLRIQDNPALRHALSEDHDVRCIFIITEQQWLKHKWGSNKIGFVLAHVLKLKEMLASHNLALDILECDWFSEIPNLLQAYVKKNQCSHVFFNKEYELNELSRDNRVVQILDQVGIKCSAFDDQCLLPPGDILNKQQAPYTVFTPFKKACYDRLARKPLKANATLKLKKPSAAPIKHNLPQKYDHYLKNPILKLWASGETAALNLLHNFANDKLLSYKEHRDFPALDATSKLSAYLAVGAISVQSCFKVAMDANEHIFPGGNPNIMCWIDELLWRDFYRNIIFHHPRICKSENYNLKYNRLKWNRRPAFLEKWCNGQTGIPIIDAAMRQVTQTGWMHNRLRMITAMFLTKHLLIDWRRGEDFFSQHLIDLDYASNNGGWQWCASTGTDAVPYFRIFNPITQSKKFDPKGTFIRKYCPELKLLDNTQIHDPSNHLSETELTKINYPKIMIDLSKARLQALAVFKGI